HFLVVHDLHAARSWTRKQQRPLRIEGAHLRAERGIKEIVNRPIDIQMNQKIRALRAVMPVNSWNINIAAKAQANVTERRGDGVHFITGLETFIRQSVGLRVLAEYSRRRKHGGDALSVFLITSDDVDFILARELFDK